MAPRILQIEQVQRLADPKPSVRVTANLIAPQWQAPLNVTGSLDRISIKPLPSPGHP
jgi:hypothetical protein